jgi:hypothetical protein
MEQAQRSQVDQVTSDVGYLVIEGGNESGIGSEEKGGMSYTVL